MKKLFLIFLAVTSLAVCAVAQTRTIKGVVLYQGDDDPLVGATVMPIGGGNGTSTDLEGRFTLSVSQSVNKLRVSYVGMVTKTVDITSDDMIIWMSNTDNNLDEVMVVAYGTAKKSAFTGSASVVDAAQLERRLVTDVTSALSGSVAGVQTLGDNGQPGVAPKVRIRGVGSINAGNNPLYVLDGVPYDGDIASINPNDIESMTVLKDAASAALYGSRGANGVIMLTTKKGKEGAAKITFDARWGANSRLNGNFDVIKSPEQYLELMYSSFNRYGLIDGMSVEEANALANENIFPALGYQMYTVPDGQQLIGMNGRFNPNAKRGYSDGDYYYTPDDWAKNTYRNGFRQEYNLSVSGATDRFNYYASVAYLKDEGLIDNSDFERLSTLLSADYQAKKWLKLGTTMSYVNTNSRYPDLQTTTNSSGNAFLLANNIAPVYPMFVRDADGNLMHDANTGLPIYDYGDEQSTNGYRNWMSMANPVGDLHYNTEKYLTDQFNGKWYVSITPIDGLTVMGTAGLNLSNQRTHLVQNRYYGQSASYGGSAAQANYRDRSLMLQGMAEYRKTFNSVHNMDILALYESNQENMEYLSGYGTFLYKNDDFTMDNIINDRDPSGYVHNYALRKFLVRANYNYDNRFFGSASYVREASSVFAPGHRWGNFWAVSAAWEMSKEKFLQDATWLDMLKLKASFGQQGNDYIYYKGTENRNYYAYTDQYTVSGANSVWADAVLYSKGNRDLTWETSSSFNIGVDFSFWQSKLSGSIEYYNRHTSDMLYDRPVSPSLGYTSVPENIGSMRNNGFELEVNYRPITTRNITWNVNLNLTYAANKVLKLSPDLNGELIKGSRIYREGESMYQLYLVKWAGVDPETGEAQYWARGLDGKEFKTSQYSLCSGAAGQTVDNRAATGNLMPKVYGGFGTSLTAYGFDFNISFAYQIGGKLIDYGYMDLMHGCTDNDYGQNWHVDILKAWTPENRNTDVPRLCYNDTYTNSTSDRFIKSSNYISINNITLGYTLPNRLTKRIGIESVRVYGVADNVALWSRRKGLDPRQSFVSSESAIYGGSRCISGGIKLTF